MKRQIKGVFSLVERLLTEYPPTRDDDRLLILKVWAEQYPELRNRERSVEEFTSRFLNKTFTDPESIRRSRQKIQELNPNLRGKSYSRRQKESSVISQMMA